MSIATLGAKLLIWGLLCLCFSGIAQDTATVNDSSTIWRKSSITGIVETVNIDIGSIQVKGSDSLNYLFYVDTAVHVEQFRIGDTVAIEYYQAFALDFRIPTDEERKNPDQSIEGVVTPPSGTTPDLEALPQIKTIITIDSINSGEKSVIVQQSGGRRFVLYVPDKRLFTQLSVDDELVVIYAPAIAISINRQRSAGLTCVETVLYIQVTLLPYYIGKQVLF